MRSALSPHSRTFLAAALVVAWSASAHAEGRLVSSHEAIVNGVAAVGFPTVGALLQGTNPDTAGTYCSGTLIGCETFLTAAHCVDGYGPGDFFVFLPSAGIVAVSSIAMHPDYDFPLADLAVLKLASPVNGIAPSHINTAGPPPFGSAGTIVGFGRAGGGSFDYGIKRSGLVSTAPCVSAPNGGSDATLVCWDFTAPIGAPGFDSNTCNADSGGPLFADLGGGPVIAGVTSGGSSATCLATDHSYDAAVYTYRSWVQTEGGTDLANLTCGALPQVGSPGTEVTLLEGTLVGGTTQQLHQIEVPNGTTTLRIALNGNDDGTADFDLYVKAGSVPTTSVYDCRRNGGGQFGVCEFAAPAAGPWYVLVTRFSGGGAYQVTVSRFGVDCAEPGNEGAPCDDGNVCTNGDVCGGGTCAGSPVANGTACADGNPCTGPDQCTAGACGGAPLANGTPCDDGNPCSQPDTCQAGTCNGAAPALGCKLPLRPGAAFFRLENRSADPKDRLHWRWRNGAATTKGEFGAPTEDTPYTLCIYDEIASTPVRRVLQQLAPGGAWTASSHGYKYRDKVLATSGVQSLQLKDGLAGKASITITGKSGTLGLPALPFAQQSEVIVQLLNGSVCWESRFSTHQQNDGQRFKAKGD